MSTSPRKKPIASMEVIETRTPQFYCDGGKGVSGHPRVYLIVNHRGVVDCPYCGRHYQLVKGHGIH